MIRQRDQRVVRSRGKLAKRGAGELGEASDDVGGVQFQNVKIDIGGNGLSVPLSSANPLPVSVTSANTTVTDGRTVVTTATTRVPLASSTACKEVIITAETDNTGIVVVGAAATELGISLRWEGEGAGSKGYDATGRCIVAVDPRYFRPTEVESLLGDATKAREKLGWTPKITFAELVSEMVREDLNSAERDELSTKHGYKSMDYHE